MLILLMDLRFVAVMFRTTVEIIIAEGRTKAKPVRLLIARGFSAQYF